MKKLSLLAALLSIISIAAPLDLGVDYHSQLAKKQAFDKGENLVYEVSYGMFTAGRAEFKVQESDKVHKGKKLLHFIGLGYSTGMFEWFFRVRDRYESWFDLNTLKPVESFRDVDEGGFIIQSRVTYVNDTEAIEHWNEKKKGSYQVPINVQDMLSAFYYARSHDGKALKNGQVIEIPIFIDHEVYNFQLKLVKREVIKTKLGKVRCLVFKPAVQEGRIFNEKESVTLWVTDDLNKIPVLLKSKILVGSIKMEILSAEGVLYPLAIEK